MYEGCSDVVGVWLDNELGNPDKLGFMLGAFEGTPDVDGISEGRGDGLKDGLVVGLTVGLIEGAIVGLKDVGGSSVGTMDG